MLTLSFHGSTQMGASEDIRSTSGSFTVTDLPGIGPTAIPITTAALGRFLALQRAINAFIATHNIIGAKPVVVDGRIGPGTRTMYNLVVGFIDLMEPTSSITSMGLHAEDMAAGVGTEAGVRYDASVPSYMTIQTSTPKPTSLLTAQITSPKKSKALWWVAGALALTSIVVGVVTYSRMRA